MTKGQCVEYFSSLNAVNEYEQNRKRSRKVNVKDIDSMKRRKKNLKIMEIILMNTEQKLVTKILTDKIENKINVFKKQQDFRKNRSNVNAKFIKIQLVENSMPS